jgi:hypothetical protein
VVTDLAHGRPVRIFGRVVPASGRNPARAATDDFTRMSVPSEKRHTPISRWCDRWPFSSQRTIAAGAQTSGHGVASNNFARLARCRSRKNRFKKIGRQESDLGIAMPSPTRR